MTVKTAYVVFNEFGRILNIHPTIKSAKRFLLTLTFEESEKNKIKEFPLLDMFEEENEEEKEIAFNKELEKFVFEITQEPEFEKTPEVLRKIREWDNIEDEDVANIVNLLKNGKLNEAQIYLFDRVTMYGL